MTPSRAPALVALVLLGSLLVAVIATTTPWRPLGSGVARTAAEPDRDFSSAERAREDAFHTDVRPPGYLSLVVGLAVVAGLGLTPLGARIVERAGRLLGGGWVATAALGVVAVVVIGRIATLGLDMWSEKVLRRYGLSTQTWATWTTDQLKSLGVTVVVSVIAAVVLYGAARWSPRWWWAWAGAAGALLTVLMSFAYPLVVEPLFNKFESMPDGTLRTSLLELAEDEGVPVSDVLVADASRRTNALNAYVSGIGATRRIVVYDTLLEKAPPAEVRLVVAHELGHVVEHDVRDGTLLGAFGVMVATTALWLALSSSWLRERAGVAGMDDARGVALVAFLVAAATLLSGPVQALVSRRVEARADVHSLDASRDVGTFIDIEKRLATENLSDLDPPRLHYIWFASHPTSPERIALARDWARREGLDVP